MYKNENYQQSRSKLWIRLAWIINIFFISFNLNAQTTANFPITFDQENISSVLQVFGLLTVLSLAPGILMMVTSFTRNIVVLSMLRNALGLQQTPPNSVLMSLALFLTMFTMMPVAKVIYHDAWIPMEEKISTGQAFEKTVVPVKSFMLKQTREKDLALLLKLADDSIPNTKEEVPLYTLIRRLC